MVAQVKALSVASIPGQSVVHSSVVFVTVPFPCVPFGYVGQLGKWGIFGWCG